VQHGRLAPKLDSGIPRVSHPFSVDWGRVTPAEGSRGGGASLAPRRLVKMFPLRRALNYNAVGPRIITSLLPIGLTPNAPIRSVEAWAGPISPSP
jgi:hypothetical protein